MAVRGLKKGGSWSRAHSHENGNGIAFHGAKYKHFLANTGHSSSQNKKKTKKISGTERLQVEKDTISFFQPSDIVHPPKEISGMEWLQGGKDRPTFFIFYFLPSTVYSSSERNGFRWKKIQFLSSNHRTLFTPQKKINGMEWLQGENDRPTFFFFFLPSTVYSSFQKR